MTRAADMAALVLLVLYTLSFFLVTRQRCIRAPPQLLTLPR